MNKNQIIINYTKYYYKLLFKTIEKQMRHVDFCYNNYIFNNNEKNQYIKCLNDIMIEATKLYTNILEKYGDKYNTQNNFIIEAIEFQKSLNIKNNIIKQIDEHFEFIKDQIMKMASNIGFYKASVPLKLILGKKYKNNLKNNKNTNAVFYFIKKYFVPTTFKIINKQSDCNKISFLNIDSQKDSILNCLLIDIPITILSCSFEFKGYFKSSLTFDIIRNYRTIFSFIDDNLNSINKEIEKIENVPKSFLLNYNSNMSPEHILFYNNGKLSDKIKDDYNFYKNISKMSFKNLMKDFLDDKSIKYKFETIKMLLMMGNQNDINYAGLLFSLLRDKKSETELISNILYNNLNYLLQLKLKKTNITIKNELDKLKNITIEDIDVKKRILFSKTMPDKIKRLAFEKNEELKSANTDYYKQKIYIDTLVNFPWLFDESTDIFNIISKNAVESQKFIQKISETLDKQVFGHDESKTVIQELIGKWISNPQSSGKVIGLYGPPGVGKTLIAKSLGTALQIPFTEINLGGMEDRSVLGGHSYTYSSSQPGLIVTKMIEAGSSRCIMYFDELDKCCTKHGINEIFNLLIHVTDSNTNTQFNDSFFNEVTFDLSKVLFVFSYNDPTKIDKILLDRMEKIEVKPYTTNEKIKIVEKFIIKEICESINMNSDFLTINNKEIEYIIDNYTCEAGVRELKRKLEKIYLKINLDKINKTNIFKDDIPAKIILTNDLINHYLKKPKENIKKIHNNNQIGIVNGLYATNNGTGGIIPILMYYNYIGDKFTLNMTGNQGNIMKESVNFSFTIAMNLIKDKYRKKFMKLCPLGLHIHTPDASTPKDGPSAGVAFTVAFMSIILNKKIKNNIAITGEIELNGNVTAIGGLTYKLKGAKKAGVTTIFIPKENETDLKNILEKNEDLKDLEIICVEHIAQLLNHILIEEEEANFDFKNYLN